MVKLFFLITMIRKSFVYSRKKNPSNAQVHPGGFVLSCLPILSYPASHILQGHRLTTLFHIYNDQDQIYCFFRGNLQGSAQGLFCFGYDQLTVLLQLPYASRGGLGAAPTNTHPNTSGFG